MASQRNTWLAQWFDTFTNPLAPSRTRRLNQLDGFAYESLEARKVMTSLAPLPVESGTLYQIHGVDGQQGQLSEVDLVNQSFSDVGENSGFKINATGFRVADGLIYGLRRDSNELVRIGADGSNETLGKIDGFPTSGSFSGDFGEDGLLYMRNGSNFYGINVDTVTVDNVISASENVNRTYDIAWNPKTGLHYSIRRAGTKSEFISIDLRNGETAGQVTVINDDLQPSGTYGALFSDASGRVVAANNQGGLYEVDLTTGEATFAGYSPRASSNDGAFSAAGTLNLPPVVQDSWMSILEGDSQRQLPITTPYDLEGQQLSVTVTGLPDSGQIVGTDGSPVVNGQQLSVEELTALRYESPQEFDSEQAPTSFRYEVSDGTLVSAANVEISFAGLSRIDGSVIVLDDSEESSFAGYAYNNEILLTGENYRGEQVSRATFTDVDGRFLFDDVAPGVYQVEQVQPYVVYDGHVTAVGQNVTIADNSVSNLRLSESPQAVSGITFYEHAPSLISGFSYIDHDADGKVGVTESGIAGVTVGLVGVDFNGNGVSATTTTDNYGFYEFRDLAPGTYDLTQTQPTNFIDGQSSVGEFGGTPLNNAITGIKVGAGEAVQNYNFGEHRSSSLSGSVFIDNDLDSVNDQGDTPLEGITIRLSGVDFRGEAVQAVTTTAADGTYRFDGLLAGKYELFQEQPDALEDGRSHVGIFNNDETVLSTNGVAETNRITGIEIGFDRHGRSYDFSEKIDYEFAGRFDETLVFSGTAEADVFVFSAGTTHHYVEVNGVSHYIDASKNTNIVFDTQTGDDRVYMTGSSNVERVITTEASAIMRGETFRVQTNESSWHIIDSGGGYDKVTMYDTPEMDRAKLTQDYTRVWNGDGYFVETRDFHRSYFYSDNGGDDRAYFYDSKYDDTIKMTSNNARMISRKFYSFVRDVERVYAYSVNGGSDRSQFWDSHLDRDVFQARPDYARMYNEGYYNVAEGFEQADAFAFNAGANDRAYLFGSAGKDILVSTPGKTGINGDGYAMDVHGFERTYSVSNGGDDQALLFDSKLDDRFIANPDSATLYNDQYYLNASGFAKVDAYSSRGGNDRAYFHDSVGDDTMVALENEVRLFGDTFDNNSHGFSRAYLHSTAGGNDTAILFDTAQADTIKLGSETSKMYGDTYYTWLNQFEDVQTKFTNASRHDRAIVFGSVDADTLAASGELGDLIFDHGLDFIYDPTAFEPGELEESDLVAIFEDLVG